MKRAYNLRKYFVNGVAVFILWFILDSARQVIVGAPYADLTWFSLQVLISFTIGLVVYKISQLLDLRKKITQLLIGLPVYSNDGKWLGMVESINKKSSIVYKPKTTKKPITIKAGEFVLSEGKVLLN